MNINEFLRIRWAVGKITVISALYCSQYWKTSTAAEIESHGRRFHTVGFVNFGSVQLLTSLEYVLTTLLVRALVHLFLEAFEVLYLPYQS